MNLDIEGAYQEMIAATKNWYAVAEDVPEELQTALQEATSRLVAATDEYSVVRYRAQN